jgi:hypothetical protein
MRTGDRVVRKDSPAVRGTIIALHGSQARVYWSPHFSQLVDLAKLTRPGKAPREASE